MVQAASLHRDEWELPELPRPSPAVPSVDAPTMLEADRIATDRLGLTLLQMMENAGRELANLVRLTLGGSVNGRRVVVLVGSGNKAGGGLAAARRLACWGADVCVAFARPVARLRPGASAQIEPLIASGARTAVAGHDRTHPQLAAEVIAADAVIDALIGYSLTGAPDTAYQALIGMAPLGAGPVISIDVPSGIDGTTGERLGAAVTADATLSLALPKRGTEMVDGRRFAGVRYLADIGIPPSVFREFGVETGGIFAEGPLVRLDSNPTNNLTAAS